MCANSTKSAVIPREHENLQVAETIYASYVHTYYSSATSITTIYKCVVIYRIIRV